MPEYLVKNPCVHVLYANGDDNPPTGMILHSGDIVCDLDGSFRQVLGSSGASRPVRDVGRPDVHHEYTLGLGILSRSDRLNLRGILRRGDIHIWYTAEFLGVMLKACNVFKIPAWLMIDILYKQGSELFQLTGMRYNHGMAMVPYLSGNVLRYARDLVRDRVDNDKKGLAPPQICWDGRWDDTPVPPPSIILLTSLSV